MVEIDWQRGPATTFVGLGRFRFHVFLQRDDDAMVARNFTSKIPETIMIGEICDRKTMQHAMTCAETGHLCLSRLHANNANQASENADPKTDLSLRVRLAADVLPSAPHVQIEHQDDEPFRQVWP